MLTGSVRSPRHATSDIFGDRKIHNGMTCRTPFIFCHLAAEPICCHIKSIESLQLNAQMDSEIFLECACKRLSKSSSVGVCVAQANTVRLELKTCCGRLAMPSDRVATAEVRLIRHRQSRARCGVIAARLQQGSKTASPPKKVRIGQVRATHQVRQATFCHKIRRIEPFQRLGKIF